jgi:hypothetical protein
MGPTCLYCSRCVTSWISLLLYTKTAIIMSSWCPRLRYASVSKEAWYFGKIDLLSLSYPSLSMIHSLVNFSLSYESCILSESCAGTSCDGYCSSTCLRTGPSALPGRTRHATAAGGMQREGRAGGKGSEGRGQTHRAVDSKEWALADEHITPHRALALVLHALERLHLRPSASAPPHAQTDTRFGVRTHAAGSGARRAPTGSPRKYASHGAAIAARPQHSSS